MEKSGVWILMLLSTVLAAPLMAYQGMPGCAGPDKQEIVAKLGHLSETLQLTPQQKQQMLPILLQEAQHLKGVKESSSLTSIQKVLQVKDIGSATDARVMPLLNPEQQQKWQAMREQSGSK